MDEIPAPEEGSPLPALTPLPTPLVPEEDQPLGAPRRRRSRVWLELLTPIAIVVAGASISGAVWLGRDGGSDPDSEAGLAATPSDSADASTFPTAADPGTPPSLLQTFLNYGTEAGLDNAEFQSCLFEDGSVDLVTEQLRRGAALGVSGTPTFFVNNKRVVGAQPLAVFQEIIDLELADPPDSIDAYSESIKALAATSPPRFEIVNESPDVSDAEFEGSPEAPVIIAEFSDFQCPFCQRWTQDTLGALRTRLGEDVALAFLHFPIVQIHPNAGNASVAAYCAGRQGKFWEMHDILFRRQQEWQSLAN
ncbi:MAG: DsbA family protein [Dehalococcoidia bacterium]